MQILCFVCLPGRRIEPAESLADSRDPAIQLPHELLAQNGQRPGGINRHGILVLLSA
jgi:hypothetical protein